MRPRQNGLRHSGHLAKLSRRPRRGRRHSRLDLLASARRRGRLPAAGPPQSSSPPGRRPRRRCALAFPTQPRSRKRPSVRPCNSPVPPRSPSRLAPRPPAPPTAPTITCASLRCCAAWPCACPCSTCVRAPSLSCRRPRTGRRCHCFKWGGLPRRDEPPRRVLFGGSAPCPGPRPLWGRPGSSDLGDFATFFLARFLCPLDKTGWQWGWSPAMSSTELIAFHLTAPPLATNASAGSLTVSPESAFSRAAAPLTSIRGAKGSKVGPRPSQCAKDRCLLTRGKCSALHLSLAWTARCHASG